MFQFFEIFNPTLSRGSSIKEITFERICIECKTSPKVTFIVALAFNPQKFSSLFLESLAISINETASRNTHFHTLLNRLFS